MHNKKLFTDLVVLLLIVLFLHTAISKFIDFEGFRSSINNQPFPDIFTPFLVWALPVIEIGIVILLLFGRTRRTGLYASLILMSLFTIYTALVLLGAFTKVPCSCGGVVAFLSWRQHLIFNLFFVLITAIAIKLNKSDETTTRFSYTG